MKKVLDIDIDAWCIPISIIFGAIVGLCVPGNSDLSPGYRRVSSVIGWIYFFAWTLSFYPQVILNATRKSTIGMVSDKILYDFIGFSCLSTYCIAMYYVDSVRKEYRDHYNGNNPKVTLNDVCFAVHALLFTFVQIGQIAYYNGMKQLPSKLCLISTSTTLLVIIFYLLLALYVNSTIFIMLYWLNFLSYIKISITMVKYIPQVLLNYSRKSTVGWSINACVLDLIGSITSMLQLFLDCYDTNDWSGLVGDIVKFLLGLFSLMFDIIFIIQHYVLYGNQHQQNDSLNSENDEKRRLLLENGENGLGESGGGGWSGRKGDDDENERAENEEKSPHDYHPPSLSPLHDYRNISTSTMVQSKSGGTGGGAGSPSSPFSSSSSFTPPPPISPSAPPSAPTSSSTSTTTPTAAPMTSSNYSQNPLHIHTSPTRLQSLPVDHNPSSGTPHETEIQSDGNNNNNSLLQLNPDAEFEMPSPVMDLFSGPWTDSGTGSHQEMEKSYLDEVRGPIYEADESLWE